MSGGKVKLKFGLASSVMFIPTLMRTSQLDNDCDLTAWS